MSLKRTLAVIGLTALAGNPLATAGTLISGTVTAIEAPNIIRIATSANEHFYLDLVDAQFGVLTNVACRGRNIDEWGPAQDADKATEAQADYLCNVLEDWLKNRRVQAEITEITPPRVRGYLIVDEALVNHRLLREGLLQADTRQTRSAAALISENEARCNYKGLWRYDYSANRRPCTH